MYIFIGIASFPYVQTLSERAIQRCQFSCFFVVSKASTSRRFKIEPIQFASLPRVVWWLFSEIAQADGGSFLSNFCVAKIITYTQTVWNAGTSQAFGNGRRDHCCRSCASPDHHAHFGRNDRVAILSDSAKVSQQTLSLRNKTSSE